MTSDEMASKPLLRPENETFLGASQSLKGMFAEIIQRNFEESVHLADHQVMDYVADLLIRFSRTEELYRIRDARGRALEDVGEMLMASNPLLDAPSFDAEREVRKHIGDFTLFFAGLFPEAVNHWRLRRARLDAFLDYIQTGKESYYIVSEFNQFEYKSSAPLFKKLSEEFESCVFGLNLVKRDFERMRQESYVRARKLLI
ncbi:MAG: hypothetical protein A3H94_03550 [Acidobacteria bacterium RIFCSPLOWO2_02_FULL_60_20]|nr:MAG: hypothetical protein A3H94_03550 [Acidobacteria bacterium RIFCSPLOWO2_02_FULL_60_20]